MLAAAEDDTLESRQALESLCEKYWYPLYAFVRRDGYDVDDAQDLTQGFFTVLLEKKFLKDVKKERGRLRNFLLVALKHYISNEWHRDDAQERGGCATPLSLDLQNAEGHYILEPSDHLTPDKVYLRGWVLTLFEQVIEKMREQIASEEKMLVFERLKLYLTDMNPRISYSLVAQELGMTDGAVRVAVHRLRRRFGDLMREEIAQTLTNPDPGGRK